MMRSSILLTLLFGILVSSSPVEREDFQDEYEDEILDSLEDEELDQQGFTCSGKAAETQNGRAIKYADPTSCSHWYECSNGQKRYACHQEGKVFREDLQYCVTGTGCNRPSRTTTRPPNPSSTHAPVRPFSCVGKNSGLHPDVNDCSKYFHCSNGIKYDLQCQHGLWYDDYHQRCDYPKNVDRNRSPCTPPANN